jgi:[acyl-carrier-protein] S-malonyltransferase
MNAYQTAWLFPGQGAQKVGMGRRLWEAEPMARQTFEEADDILGFALSKLMFNGPKEELDDTINTQPALYVHSLALVRLIEYIGGLEKPKWVVGHSMGEYSALAASGAFSFAAGLRLVRTRGRLMKRAGEENPGGMAAIIKLDDATVTTICAEASREGKPVQVANFNCPGQIVISGAKAAVKRAMKAAKAAGARKVVYLDISIPAHSPLMADILPDFTHLIQTTPFQDATIPLIGNVKAAPLQQTEHLRRELIAQLTGSVRWTDSMRFLIAQGITTVIEIGSGKVLTGLMKRIDRKIKRINIGTWEELQQVG